MSTKPSDLASQLTGNLVTTWQAAADLGMSEHAVRNWRARYKLGIRIGKIVYFRPDEVARMAAGSSRKSSQIRLERVKRSHIRKVRKEIWIRPEIWAEAERQAAAVSLSLDDYFQLLVYGNAGTGWRNKLKPPLEFDQKK